MTIQSSKNQWKFGLYVVMTLWTLLSGMSLQAAEKITYIHNDALGSPIMATDEQGKIVWKEDYQPYGKRNIQDPKSDNNQQFYTGKYEETKSGLIYFGARWYNPSIGRFYSVDPQRFDEANLHSFNRYAYANNNPYKFVDPDGENPKLILDFGLNVALNYATTGNPQVFSAIRETVQGVLNPLKTVQKAKRLANIISNRGLKKAEVLRDAKLGEISKLSKTQQSKITTVVGAHDPATGKIAVGVKVSCRANSGKCAEDLASELLGNPKNIEFTKVIRPRNGKVVPRCDRCVGRYGPEK